MFGRFWNTTANVIRTRWCAVSHVSFPTTTARSASTIANSSNSTSTTTNTNTNNFERKNPENYLQKLHEANVQLPEYLQHKSSDELIRFIGSLLEQYDYELYHKSYDLVQQQQSSSSTDTIELNETLHLEPFELNDVLQTSDEQDRLKRIRYFVSSKVSTVLKRQKKREKQLSKQLARKANEVLQERIRLNTTTGIWNADGSKLIYGLWHNTMFVKCRRSCVSKLADHRLANPLVTSATNARVIIDLDHAHHLTYFNIRRFGNQLRDMFTFNKYKSFQPFTIEFCQSPSSQLVDKSSEDSKLFDDIFSRILVGWSSGDGDQSMSGDFQFPYTRHFGTPLSKLLSMSNNNGPTYCILPSASKPLTIEEASQFSSPTYIFPAYTSRNLRDSQYETIEKEMKRLGVAVRRLPTEHVVWYNFHGVIPVNLVFAILHDALYDCRFSWPQAFRKHLDSLLVSEQELIERENNREMKYKKRQQWLMWEKSGGGGSSSTETIIQQKSKKISPTKTRKTTSRATTTTITKIGREKV